MVCHLIVEPLQFLAYLERLVNFQLISFREIHGHGKGHPRVTTHTHTHTKVMLVCPAPTSLLN